MNKRQLEQNVGSPGRLRPAAKNASAEDIDDDWVISKLTDSTVELTHASTGAQVRTNKDIADHAVNRLLELVRASKGSRDDWA